MPRLLCIGEVIVEMVAEKVDQSARSAGKWLGPYPSGAPAILADQAALCGVEVTMLGTVGADAFGDVCLDRLRRDGVDVDRLAVDDARPTGVAFVRYRQDGSRSFIFHVADSAAGTLPFREQDLAGVDCVHLMGSSAFSERAVATLSAVADAAFRRGVTISFDPNIRRELLSRPEFVDVLQRILHRASYVLASEGELPLLMEMDDDLRCASQLLETHTQVVVLKRGQKGSVLLLPGAEPLEIPPIEVDEVDATGAGDCFGGTFLSLVLQGWAPEQAVRYATVAGGLSVTERGPMSGNRPIQALREFAAPSA